MPMMMSAAAAIAAIFHQATLAAGCLRSPAAENSPQDCFLDAASNPYEQLTKSKNPQMGALAFGATGGI